MSTIEQEAYSILGESRYKISIAGQDIWFRYATLDDLQKISAITSKLPVLDEVLKTEKDPNSDVPQIVDAFKYAKDLGDIIAVSVETEANTRFKLINPLLSFLKRRKTLKTIYKKANTMDIHIAVQLILLKNHVFFYQKTITSLKGMNHLTPTKETDQTVLGQ